MALVVITSAAAAAPATAAAGRWHEPCATPGTHLESQAGDRGGAAAELGASNMAPGHLTKTANAIYSVIYNAIILYSIDMHIKHES